ncbi:amidohydrolase family protein [Rahnella victoriana]|uniref:amidohydrolase family protein n=1 Tax=Rahnella victoriana TaxID=1510570 RepID=UPI001E52F03D|nr:amidohydrolase family protein [Rahnella victoriana]UHM93182.1 cytosine deaminase [Rahnella victoriana]
MNLPDPTTPLNGIANARLPAWLLPAGWPLQAGEPVTADLRFDAGIIASVTPAQPDQADLWNAHGALALPGLTEPHAHLDKTFTLHRSRPPKPGLLAAIETLHQDRQHWTADDLRQRAAKGMAWASANGVTHLRTHIDWFDVVPPLAWRELADIDQPGVTLERVALAPLSIFADEHAADRIARAVAESGKHCLLGGFIHSSNWDPTAMTHLMRSASRWQLNLDLHIDEELSPVAHGLSWLAHYLTENTFSGHICCSHGCALASGSEQQARDVLSVLAAQRVTLIALPMTNLLLQDAVTGRTPRQRGITLIKEAQTAGVPLLLGCDNVQDAFCPAGSYDPLDTLTCALFALQLDNVFDRQSRLICDVAALTGDDQGGLPLAPGSDASLVIFPGSDSLTWPLHSAARLVIHHGRLTHQRTWNQELSHES